MSKQQRKAGGQPGHEGTHRQLADPGRVDRRAVHLPEACGCGHEFDGSEAPVGDPVIHQQWELPPVRPLVFSVRPDPVALSVLRAAETGGSARGGVVVGVRAPA